MENMQFSFLTALFGGKIAGDVLANGKANPQGEPAAKDADGFFSFIEGLLNPARPGVDAGKEKGADDVFAGSLFAGQPPSPNPINAARAREFLDGMPVTPGVVKTQIRPSTNPLTPGQLKLSLEPPKGPGFVEAPAISTDVADKTPVISADAALKTIVDDRAQATDFGLQTKNATTPTAEQATVGGPQAPKKFNAATGVAASDGPAAALEVAPEIDGRSRETASRFDAPAAKLVFDGPNIVLPQQANAVFALAEHAAPEAFSHSAVTRDEPSALEAERFSTSRLEIVSSAADRNAHLNPIRDQVVAAVAARQSDGKLEIRLDPPELGKILIGFDRDGTDIVRAVISADSPETLDLMRRHADVFQRALEAQGFENLDLHFADKGPGENAGDMAEETIKNFRLADEGGQADVDSPAPHFVDGRLDRRL